MTERNRNLAVRLDDVTLDMVHALAAAEDVPVSQLIRTFIRDAYRKRFGGSTPPPRSRRGE